MDLVSALILLVLVVALVFGAYALGRASAFAELRRNGGGSVSSAADDRAAPAGDSPSPADRSNLPRTTSAPPVLAGGEA